jgi:chromosome segregation ATPase
LGAAARRIGSTALAAVAAKAGLKDDPVDHFVKVRGIIEDLITRLEAEAAAEVTQKSLCDEQVSAAVQSRDEQQSEVETQGATISKSEAQIALLQKEIATLSEEIAELSKALSEATELRGQESAANSKTIEDAKEGKASLDGAIEVLKEYYKIEGGAAMLQKRRYVPPNSDRDGSTVGDLAPELSYSGKYQGKTDAATGVIGLLEVIQADFQRTVDAVTAAEEDAVTKFGEFKTQTEADITTKQGEKEAKEGEITTAEEAITTATDNKRDAEALHTSAIEELEKLKAMCVEGAESYEERARKREQEVEALKEALNILENFNK